MAPQVPFILTFIPFLGAGCLTPDLNPSAYLVNYNLTYARYNCRAGYKYFAGDLERLCDVNGTWSGQTLLCTVDSILPKAYLVVLIVGATIAAFLACIPYDFYRFRQRKKKVRDHQERLSLVTRIAPGHAKVILDASVENHKVSPQPPRRFGLKSLFSVFRFVGGKMKTSGDSMESASLPEENSVGNGKGTGNGAFGASEAGPGSSSPGCSENNKTAEVDPDGATASTLIFSPHHSSSCPEADLMDHDADLYINKVADEQDNDNDSDDFDADFLSRPRNRREDLIIRNAVSKDNESADGNLATRSEDTLSPTKSDHNICGDVSQEQSPFTPDLSDSSPSPDQGSRSSGQARNNIFACQRANQVFNQQLESSIRGGNATTADDLPASEPATVEVTSINETTSSSHDHHFLDSPSSADLPPPKMVSPTSSASSPDVTCSSSKKGDLKDKTFRTFHFQNEMCSNPAYHSMPAISDAP